jgi:hypothetical protein
VTGVIDGRAVRYAMTADGRYLRADGDEVLTDDALRARAGVPGQPLTFTCLPPGRGTALAAPR